VLSSTYKRIFPYIQSSTQTNSLTNHSVTTTAAYDSYGNPTQIAKSYNNGVTETTVTDYSAYLNTTDWLIGRPNSSTVTYTKSGETSVSHTVRYTYYTDDYKARLYLLQRGHPARICQKPRLRQSRQLSAGLYCETHVNYTYEPNGVR
jgi:hypothetical protein